MTICDREFNNITVKVSNLSKKCRYHKKIGEEFLLSQISPDNFCFHAFYTAHSLCLNLLYNKHKKQIVAFCPSYRSYIIMEISRGPLRNIMLSISCFIRKIISKIYPVDIIKNRILIKVLKVKDCPKGYKAGDSFEFNIGDKNEICPAAFFHLYPFLESIGKDNNFPWNNANFRCPDNKADIVFEINKNEK